MVELYIETKSVCESSRILNIQFQKYKTLRFSLKKHESIQFVTGLVFIIRVMREILHYSLNRSFFEVV